MPAEEKNARSWEEAASLARGTRQKMSLAEKVALLSNAQEPSDHLDLIRLADGAAGVRRAPGVTEAPTSTALPAPIALAATWDAQLAAEYGRVLGRELRATGHHVLLGPAVDIARVGLTGRIYESFGEDPQLTADLVVAEIGGIQEAGAQACVKHFALNNQEASRATIDVRIDEVALRELYLPPFEAAVVEAQAASVMSSYNRVEGTYASHSEKLLRTILRDEWGFEGWVVSDFLANHALHESIEAGLDWELTGDAPEWGSALIAAVENGSIGLDAVDDRVDRILAAYYRLAQDIAAEPLSDAELDEHHALAYRVAVEGTVLLRNDGILPLSTHPRQIAVIGADADDVTAAGAGSPLVAADPQRSDSVTAALRRTFADASVVWEPGTDPIGPGVLLPGPAAVPAGLLRTPEGSPGVQVTVWAEDTVAAAPIWQGTSATIELNTGFFAGPGFRAPSPGWSALPDELPPRHRSRWEGSVVIPVAGTYRLTLTHLGSVRLEIDGEVLLDEAVSVDPEQEVPAGILWDGSGAQVHDVELHLQPGSLPFRLDYATDVPAQSEHYGAQLRFGWEMPEGAVPPLRAAAAAAAADAELAVVVARAYESEAMDRPSTVLPHDQNALIDAVVATGTPTVVITMSGGPIDISGWTTQPAAHLHAWYAGQAQGAAVADLLTGAAEPTARLPLTFPAHPLRAEEMDPASYPGVDGRVTYGEGLDIGYRATSAAAVYPFGFGLGYARIALGEPRLSDDGSQILVEASNRSQRPGAELVQIYLADADGARPTRLIAWQRLRLAPGETTTVGVELPSTRRRWQEWDGHWRPRRGTRRLLVGTSAAHFAGAVIIDLDAMQTSMGEEA